MFRTVCGFECVISRLRCLHSGMFYAVRVGRNPGIYHSWNECFDQVNKYPQARYRKFPTREEALEFVNGEDSSPELVSESEDDTPPPRMSSSQMMDALNTVRLTARTLQHQMELMSSTFGTLNDQIASLENIIQNSNMSNSPMAGSSVMSPSSRPNGSSYSSPNKSNHSTDSNSGYSGYSKGLKRSYTDGSQSSGGKSGPSGIKRFKSTDASSDDCAGWSGRPFSDPTAPTVYTDGACFQNGKNGARAGIGVYWGPGNKNNVAERLAGRPTNNRAEIHAAVKAVRQAKQMGKSNLVLHTDSQFLINSITKWIKGWKKNGWTLSTGGPVINREDFEELDEALKGINVKWVHVRGHQGIAGNEAADRLANAGARKTPSYS